MATAGVSDLFLTDTVTMAPNGFKTTGGNYNILCECCSQEKNCFWRKYCGFCCCHGALFCFVLFFPEENRSLMGSHFEIGGKEENSMLML